MISLRWQVALWLTVLSAAPVTRAQFVTNQPHIGYVYPAGGQQGTTVEVTVGGQFLDGVRDVILSGQGVRATFLQQTKPLTQKRINELRQKFQQARRRQQTQKNNRGGNVDSIETIVRGLGVSPQEFREFQELNDPKRQPNPQLAETVTLQMDFASDAAPGDRELRLVTKGGLTNPIRFRVGQLPEHQEIEPNDQSAGSSAGTPPLVLNGQIMPGDIDRFRIHADKGMRLVIAVAAQALVPYLADAVPGWFQATLVLYDSDGNEVAYADDYRIRPDPVIFYEVPQAGDYVLEIKDSIYRGRQDFVYRITVGELPYVTSIFPMGSRRGRQTTVAIEGWNLPSRTLPLNTDGKTPGIHPISVRNKDGLSNEVPFAIGTLPESLESEPNDRPAEARRLEPPVVVNGRIDRPGDWDVFSFHCRERGRIFAEVHARRLGSPLDSVLKLTDADGRQLLVNDDHVDQGAGLSTHHADSRISVTIPSEGLYYLHLGDTQRKGAADYTYRLHINAQGPNFRLRVAPPSINARPASNVLIHVFALRRDGFSDDILLKLKDPPPGFGISGAWVPSGQDDVWLTLAIPPLAPKEPVSLRLEGRAVINGEMIYRVAMPCEDMMQAFINRHLVPAQDWMISVTGTPRFKLPGKRSGGARTRVRVPKAPSPSRPVKLPVGGNAVAKIPAPPAVLADLEQIVLTLSDPPEGVTIEKLAPIEGGVAIHIRCEEGTIQPGLKGNLIAEAAIERTSKSSGKTRRVTLGILPAIPFEVVPLFSGIALD